jgi:methyltransferase (TIGR00027 family)
VRHDRPSTTAAWVATCRGLAGLLPPGARLCEDSWGLRFGGSAAEALAVAARLTPHSTWAWFRALRPAALSLLWVQLRTREIDDLLLEFVRCGGRQLVILGAGYDARAVRLSDALGDVRTFEVDHPATQARKRDVLRRAGWSGTGPAYLSWDFERDAMDTLPRRLAALGHDPAFPTFTIWEGVTMYLSERAIEETVSAVAGWSGPESTLAFEYFRRSSLATRPAVEQVLARAVVLRDEPFRFGWEPPELAGWLAPRGFELLDDRSDVAVARRRLDARHERTFLALRGGWEFHLAVARRA